MEDVKVVDTVSRWQRIEIVCRIRSFWTRTSRSGQIRESGWDRVWWSQMMIHPHGWPLAFQRHHLQNFLSTSWLRWDWDSMIHPPRVREWQSDKVGPLGFQRHHLRNKESFQMPFEIQFGKIRVGYRVVYVSKYITLMLNLRELLLIARLEKFSQKS